MSGKDGKGDDLGLRIQAVVEDIANAEVVSREDAPPDDNLPAEKKQVQGGGRAIQDNDWTLPSGCPVEPLGLKDDLYFYLDAHGQFRQLKSDRHTRLNVFGLFGGEHSKWLKDNYGRYDNDGNLKGIEEHKIAYDLISEAGRKGVYNPTGKLRGPGCWLDGDWHLIVHCGDVVLVNGRAHRPGRIGDYVYPASEPTRRPLQSWASDGGDGPGSILKAQLETWNWVQPQISPTLLLGWTVAAIAGGALDWRPLVWITGDAGTGKSTLLDHVLEPVFGGGLVHASDATAAGIWQKIQYASLPIAVDEAEARGDPRQLDRVIELARQAASGGLVLRGGGDHTSTEFNARSCFLFSSINKPPLQPQDQSRIAVLELKSLAPGDEPVFNAQELATIGDGLRRRLIDCWPRFNELLAVWRGAMKEAGHGARGADVYGTLLACADLAQHDDPPTADDLDQWKEWLDSKALAARFDIQPDYRLCANRLLSSHLDGYRGDDAARTFADWIATAKRQVEGQLQLDHDEAEANAVLVQYGLKVVRRGETVYLAVANSHEALNRLFAGTKWQGGVWRQSLGRIDGADLANLKFGGYGSRCVLVPLDAIMGDPAED